MSSSEAGDRQVVALLLLVFATGVIDAVCLLHLGVFTAYITGSLIVFAGEVVGADASAGPSATAIVAFVIGTFVGARLILHAKATRWMLVRALLLVAAFVAVATVIAATVGIDDDWGKYATVAGLAIAMGMQLAIIRHVGLADIALPAATLVVFNLVADTPAAGGTPQRTFRRVGVVAALVAGALLGAGVARWEPWAAWAIAALVIAGASLTVSDA